MMDFSHPDDDLLPELPELELDDDRPPADDELGLEAELDLPPDDPMGGDEATGLDDLSTDELLELPPDDHLDGEEVDAIPIEGLDGDDEYGWTDDPRAAREHDQTWDDALDLPELPPLTHDDGGEEGLEDLAQLGGGGDEAPALPPLAGEDDELGDDELGFDDEVSLRSFDDDPLAFGSPLEPPACRSETLSEEPLACFTRGLAGGPEGLFTTAGGWARLGDVAQVLSVAVDPEDASRIIVGTAAGALRSTDGGATFSVANGWATEGREAAQPFFVACESSTRIWARTASGALYRSGDFGASWSGPLLLKPVAALAASPEGVVALCSGRNVPPQIALSSDGGQRWNASDGPPLGSGPMALALARDFIAVSSGAGSFLSADRGKRWSRLPGLPETTAIALASEPRGLAIYAAHPIDGRLFVVRHRPGGGEPSLLLALDAEAHALHAERSGPLTILHLASSAGLHRLTIDPDRAP